MPSGVRPGSHGAWRTSHQRGGCTSKVRSLRCFVCSSSAKRNVLCGLTQAVFCCDLDLQMSVSSSIAMKTVASLLLDALRALSSARGSGSHPAIFSQLSDHVQLLWQAFRVVCSHSISSSDHRRSYTSSIACGAAGFGCIRLSMQP